jgi:hypothetical protein
MYTLGLKKVTRHKKKLVSVTHAKGEKAINGTQPQ